MMNIQRFIETAHNPDMLETDRQSRRLKPGVVYDHRQIIVLSPGIREQELESE